MIYSEDLTPEQIAEIEARLAAEQAERERIQALTDRFNSLTDRYRLVSLAGLNYSNPALILKNAIESNDDSELAALEAQVSVVAAEVSAASLVANKVALGRQARETCQQVLDLITGFNYDRQLTAPEVTQMQSTFANIELALKSARPTTAKSLISQVEADGVLVTQQMIDMCLRLLANY